MLEVEKASNSAHVLSPLVVALLKKRGIEGIDAVSDFFNSSLKELPDLSRLHDLDKATHRIADAVDKGENIAIYGDYDVDGTTACALLYHFFQSCDVQVQVIQPSRFVEGYGIHPKAIDDAVEMGIDVLITVDCGITNCEAADRALEHPLDLIITDHHTDGCEAMPRAFAVVNPNRRDEPEDSPLRTLAGVGVAFCLALQTKVKLEKRGRNIPSLYPLLQLFAIGTICDMVPLTSLNLRLTRHGLRQLPSSMYPGLKVFFDLEERRRSTITSDKISFKIGPMINSKGRLDHPEGALKLLISENSEEAYNHYSHLEICNNERKSIQGAVFKEAVQQVMDNMGSSEHAISIAYSSDWHEGVIGIVASKLVENFKVPAIVLTDSNDDGILKGSARSAGSLSIFDCLSDVGDLFCKFGGHKAAAGFSMPRENLPNFKKGMLEKLISIPSVIRVVPEYYDMEISPEEITPKLVRELELLEPFGTGNPRPVFKLVNFSVSSYRVLKDVHVKWAFCGKDGGRTLDGISFNYLGKWNVDHPKDIFQACKEGRDELTALVTLGINHYRGNQFIQLMVEHFSLG